MTGWIKLHRAAIDHWCASEPEFLAVWIRLLCEANHKAVKTIMNGAPVNIDRGQLVYGRKVFSERSGVSISKLRRIIRVLTDEGMIDQLKTNKYSVITILNYDLYQGVDQPKTSRSPADRQQMTTSKECKEVKEKKEPKDSLEGFDEFYDAYAYKKNRGQAKKAWAKIPLADHSLVIEGANTAARIGGEFRPYPATWLNAEGWLDEHEGQLVNGELRTLWVHAIEIHREKKRWPINPNYYFMGKLSECPDDLRSANADLFPSVN